MSFLESFLAEKKNFIYNKVFFFNSSYTGQIFIQRKKYNLVCNIKADASKHLFIRFFVNIVLYNLTDNLSLFHICYNFTHLNI